MKATKCRLPSVLVCLWLLLLPQFAWAAAPRVPIIYSTDIYHPPTDPDDHFDTAVLFDIWKPDLANQQAYLIKKQLNGQPNDRYVEFTLDELLVKPPRNRDGRNSPQSVKDSPATTRPAN